MCCNTSWLKGKGEGLKFGFLISQYDCDVMIALLKRLVKKTSAIALLKTCHYLS